MTTKKKTMLRKKPAFKYRYLVLGDNWESAGVKIKSWEGTSFDKMNLHSYNVFLSHKLLRMYTAFLKKHYTGKCVSLSELPQYLEISRWHFFKTLKENNM